jgi:uncharacterized protein HemX
MKWIVAVLVVVVLALGAAGGYEIVDLRSKLHATNVRLTQAQSDASTAQSDASTAQSDASIAQSDASTAQSDASTAQSDASTAADHADKLDAALCTIIRHDPSGVLIAPGDLTNC